MEKILYKNQNVKRDKFLKVKKFMVKGEKINFKFETLNFFHYSNYISPKKEIAMKKYTVKNSIVTQSNDLIKSTQSFTLVERRLIYHILSKINPLDKNPTNIFTLRVADFGDSFPQMNKSLIYNQLKEAVDKLLHQRTIQHLTDRGTTKVFNVLQEYEYKDKEGFLSIKFSDSMMPLIYNLKTYTSIIFDNLKKLDTVYSLRMYELMLMIYKKNLANYNFGNKDIRVIEVDDLRFFLNCLNSYSSFKLFKIRVIEPALKEITKKTELSVTAEYLRTGRKIDRIRFHIFNKETGENLLEPDKPIPKRPTLKRHPNPEKYKDEETGEFYEKTFFLDRFEWACINYKRLYDYKNALKEIGQKLDDKLEKKQQEYLNIITYSITDVKENGLPFLSLQRNCDFRELLRTLEEIKNKYLHSK